MYQNMYNNPAPMGNYNPYEQNSGLLKNFFSKPVVIILAAVGGVSALMSIISFFMQIGSFNTTVRYYNHITGGQFASFYSGAQPIFVIISICSIAMTIITALGYFLLYSKSKNPDPQSNPKAGSTLLWVISIISFAATCILAVFLIIVAFILFIASGEVSSKHYDYCRRFYDYYRLDCVLLLLITVPLLLFNPHKLQQCADCKQERSGFRSIFYYLLRVLSYFFILTPGHSYSYDFYFKSYQHSKHCSRYCICFVLQFFCKVNYNRRKSYRRIYA